MILALDIGGANLKAADGRGYAASRAFPLWERPDELAGALRAAIDAAPSAERLAVTMTGELADCFSNKRDGVGRILDAVVAAADRRPVAVYTLDGELVGPDAARSNPLAVAAANWHALASFCGRFVPEGGGLVVDTGSTTTDIVPLADGAVATIARSDTERLLAGELVYTGVGRSPVCAVVSSIPWRGQPCPVAQERFATTRDAWLILGEIAEDSADTDTADGRPATRAAARRRMARMICSDEESFTDADALEAAGAVRRAQVARIGVAARQVLSGLSAPPRCIVVSGSGEFLPREVVRRSPIEADVISLAAKLGADVSRAAPAHALAVLAREEAGV